jgi:hypothetical protein
MDRDAASEMLEELELQTEKAWHHGPAGPYTAPRLFKVRNVRAAWPWLCVRGRTRVCLGATSSFVYARHGGGSVAIAPHVSGVQVCV